jgi:excisionase family DNA binding protein
MPANNQETPLAYRVAEFCKKLGISRSTFWKLARLNKVRVIHVGRRALIPYAEAVRLLSDGA